jgi:hypothetical protein
VRDSEGGERERRGGWQVFQTQWFGSGLQKELRRYGWGLANILPLVSFVALALALALV